MTSNTKIATYDQVPKHLYFQPYGASGRTRQEERHEYFFEIVEGERDKVLAVIRCPYVAKITGDPIPATVLTMTSSTEYEEHEGYRRRTFMLAGRSGFTIADLTNFQRFRNFFETLQQLKAENLNAFVRGRDIRLVLNFPFEGESYYCNVVSGLKYDRDRTSSTYSYVWMLTVVTSGYVARKWAVPEGLKKFLETECGEEDDSCHTGRQHPCRKMAEITADMLPKEADPLADLVDISVPLADEIVTYGGLQSPRTRRTYERLHVTTNTIYESGMQWFRKLDVPKFDEYLYQAIDIIGWISNLRMECQLAFGMDGKQFARKVANSVTAGLYDQLSLAIDRLEDPLRGGIDGIYLVTENRYHATRADGLGLDGIAAAPEVPNPTTDQVIVTDYELGPYDMSVDEVSFQLYGTIDYGSEIMRLNPGLADPRTWVGGYALKPGDVLKVPAIGGLADKVGPPLGVDWMVEDYDFVWDDNKGDFVRVSGKDCYLQNTRHRILTPKGTNRAFRETGTLDIVENGEQRTAAAVASDVQQQLLLDPRTKKLRTLVFDEDVTTITVQAAVELVTSDVFGFSIQKG